MCDTVIEYENTIQYAILRKEWAGRRAGGQSPSTVSDGDN